MWAGRLNKIYCSILVMCMIMMYSTTRAQFQNSSVNETLVPGSSYTGAHIHDVTNYTYSNLLFPDGLSDLYVATMGDRGHFYYKRTVAGNPSMILDEGMEHIVISGGATRVHDAVILNNPNAAAGSAFNYCIAVAYSGPSAGGGYLDFYEWTTSGLNLVLSHNFSANDIVRISLDAHSLYAYTVVWQEYPTNELYGFGGFIPATFYPMIGANKRLLGVGTTTEGWYPDVAMTKLENPPSDAARTGLYLYYTYIDENKDACYVASRSFDDLMTQPSPIGLLGVHNVLTLTPGFGGSFPCAPGIPYPPFKHSYLPKIDAPDHSTDYTWAMVVQQFEFYPLLDDWSINDPCPYPDNVNKLLQTQITTSYRYNGGIIYDKILNDGLLTGTVAMKDNFNFNNPLFNNPLFHCRPTVAWNNDGDLIHYGWGKTQDHPNLGTHDYIGVLYDPTAHDAVTSPGGDGYRIIDMDNTLEPYNRCVAFTRQNDASNDLFIVYSADSFDPNYTNYFECTFYKHVDWANVPNIGYRGENNNNNIVTYNTESLIYQYYPNPVKNNLTLILNEPYKDDELLIEVYDITGRKIGTYKGYINEINDFVNTLLPHINSNTCVLQLMSLTQGISQTVKLNKRN